MLERILSVIGLLLLGALLIWMMFAFPMIPTDSYNG